MTEEAAEKQVQAFLKHLETRTGLETEELVDIITTVAKAKHAGVWAARIIATVVATAFVTAAYAWFVDLFGWAGRKLGFLP